MYGGGGAFSLAAVLSLSAEEAVLVVRTPLRLVPGSCCCCCSTFRFDLTVLSAAPLPATESVVEVLAVLFFRPRLTPRSAFPPLRLACPGPGGEGGCDCEDASLGFSDGSEETGFSSSLLFWLSGGGVSFSFLLD